MDTIGGSEDSINKKEESRKTVDRKLFFFFLLAQQDYLELYLSQNWRRNTKRVI